MNMEAIFQENAQSNYPVNERRVKKMLFEYGSDSLSYLSIEGEKSYYFSKNIYGFQSYVLVGKVAVCFGRPICKEEEVEKLTKEFLEFVKENKWKVCYSSITKEYGNLLETMGFVVASYGKEAVIDIDQYSLAGKKREKLRHKLKRAQKEGICVEEYRCNEKRNFILEHQIESVSNLWYEGKGPKLKFSFGDFSFENPNGKRYFVAFDKKREVQAIIMLSPYHQQKGYYLDIMQRNPNSLAGVMEKTICDAMEIINSEGEVSLSLGVAPLSGISEKEDHEKMNSLEKLFHFVYLHGNFYYDFQSLYQFKSKFNPTRWVPRCVAYQNGMNFIFVAKTIAKSRNVKKMYKKVVHCVGCYFFTNIIERIKKNRESTKRKRGLTE